MKRFLSLLLAALLLFSDARFLLPDVFAAPVKKEPSVSSSGPLVSAPSALLMDADTGTVLYQKDAQKELPPASITKIMTLLFIFEALQTHTIALDDMVTVSEHAAQMGGSQVFLEAGETQSVDTMIKCIAVASANDACVSMAEFLSGNEQDFVRKMNQKTKELGMKHTHFVNSCGLDADGHYSCALDIALMARALTTRFPKIFDYTKIWMEDITHHTNRGDKSFTLSNTNRLLKQYPDATGLKTGSTGKAKFCLCATATRNDLNLIAVILGAPDSKQRIADAKTLLDWGFSNCRVYTDPNTDPLPKISVENGKTKTLSLIYASGFRYVNTSASSGKLTKKMDLPDAVPAPVKKGEIIGNVCYFLNKKQVGKVSLLAGESIEKMTYSSAAYFLLKQFLLGKQAV